MAGAGCGQQTSPSSWRPAGADGWLITFVNLASPSFVALACFRTGHHLPPKTPILSLQRTQYRDRLPYPSATASVPRSYAPSVAETIGCHKND